MRIIATRKIDELGRLILPLELRKELDIEPGNLLDICIDGHQNILIRKSENTCILCGAENDLTQFNDKIICQECRQKMKSQ